MNPENKPSKETLEQWRIDPSNWKWGIFYFNPKDKRIFPPKKIKALGWTVNFANPWSILALVTLCLGIFLVFKYII